MKKTKCKQMDGVISPFLIVNKPPLTMVDTEYRLGNVVKIVTKHSDRYEGEIVAAAAGFIALSLSFFTCLYYRSIF